MRQVRGADKGASSSFFGRIEDNTENIIKREISSNEL